MSPTHFNSTPSFFLFGECGHPLRHLRISRDCSLHCDCFPFITSALPHLESLEFCVRVYPSRCTPSSPLLSLHSMIVDCEGIGAPRAHNWTLPNLSRLGFWASPNSSLPGRAAVVLKPFPASQLKMLVLRTRSGALPSLQEILEMFPSLEMISLPSTLDQFSWKNLNGTFASLQLFVLRCTSPRTFLQPTVRLLSSAL